MTLNEGDGGPPKTGWAKLVAELLVSDIGMSAAFWQGLLGFRTAYQRPEERFVYLERPEGAQVMLCQRNGRWETGTLDRPYGRGVMFQVYINRGVTMSSGRRSTSGTTARRSSTEQARQGTVGVARVPP